MYGLSQDEWKKFVSDIVFLSLISFLTVFSVLFYFYEKTAEQRNREAQYNLGAMYENGIGVEQDIEKAKAWYKNGKSFQKWLLDMAFNATYEF